MKFLTCIPNGLVRTCCYKKYLLCWNCFVIYKKLPRERMLSFHEVTFVSCLLLGYTYNLFSSDTPQNKNVRNNPKQLTKAEFIPRCGSKCTNQNVSPFFAILSLQGVENFAGAPEHRFSFLEQLEYMLNKNNRPFVIKSPHTWPKGDYMTNCLSMKMIERKIDYSNVIETLVKTRRLAKF